MLKEIQHAADRVRALIKKRHQGQTLDFIERDLLAYEHQLLDDLLRTAEESPQEISEVLGFIARMERYAEVVNFRLQAEDRTAASALVGFLDGVIAEFWQRESRPPRLMWMPPRRGSFTAILTIDCDPVPVATRLGLMPAHDVFDPVGSGYHSIPAARANLVLRTSSALPSSQAPAFAIGGLGQLADAVFECSGLPGKEAR